MTVKYSDGRYESINPVDICDNDYSMGNYSELVKKLGEYEDLEEQGKLLMNAGQNNNWIRCSDRMPENEQDVEITYIRQNYLNGEKCYHTARAFYEDGTLTTENSACSWYEMDNWEYDEITDSYIIPEGWFESVHFTEEFGIVDMPVIAWRPISEPYREE